VFRQPLALSRALPRFCSQQISFVLFPRSFCASRSAVAFFSRPLASSLQDLWAFLNVRSFPVPGRPSRGSLVNLNGWFLFLASFFPGTTDSVPRCFSLRIRRSRSFFRDRCLPSRVRWKISHLVAARASFPFSVITKVAVDTLKQGQRTELFLRLTRTFMVFRPQPFYVGEVL